MDYFGLLGCCYACIECGKCREPCYACRCTKCQQYNSHADSPCGYKDFKNSDENYDDCYIIIYETEKAILVKDLINEKKTWLPKSLVDYSYNSMHELQLSIPRWFVEQQGMLHEDDWWELDGLSFAQYEKRIVRKYDTRNY